MKIGINGFGRIGRLAFRAAIERPDIEVIGINDLVEPDYMAYMLKYDKAHQPKYLGRGVLLVYKKSTSQLDSFTQNINLLKQNSINDKTEISIKSLCHSITAGLLEIWKNPRVHSNLFSSTGDKQIFAQTDDFDAEFNRDERNHLTTCLDSLFAEYTRYRANALRKYKGFYKAIQSLSYRGYLFDLRSLTRILTKMISRNIDDEHLSVINSALRKELINYSKKSSNEKSYYSGHQGMHRIIFT